MEKLLLTVKEAADRLSLSRSFAYDLIRRGELRSLKIGASRRIHVDDLEAYARRLSEDAIDGD